MIKIICVGKVKESFFREAIMEYEKRIRKYHKICIEEVMDSNILTEGDLILKKLRDKDFIVTLEIDGKSMDSIQFSNWVEDSFMRHGSIVFVIGGSDGIDCRVKERANERISFSSLTFPHQLFRVILLEQIYRAFKLIHHESYHK